MYLDIFRIFGYLLKYVGYGNHYPYSYNIIIGCQNSSKCGGYGFEHRLYYLNLFTSLTNSFMFFWFLFADVILYLIGPSHRTFIRDLSHNFLMEQVVKIFLVVAFYFIWWYVFLMQLRTWYLLVEPLLWMSISICQHLSCLPCPCELPNERDSSLRYICRIILFNFSFVHFSWLIDFVLVSWVFVSGHWAELAWLKWTLGCSMPALSTCVLASEVAVT